MCMYVCLIMTTTECGGKDLYMNHSSPRFRAGFRGIWLNWALHIGGPCALTLLHGIIYAKVC